MKVVPAALQTRAGHRLYIGQSLLLEVDYRCLPNLVSFPFHKIGKLRLSLDSKAVCSDSLQEPTVFVIGLALTVFKHLATTCCNYPAANSSSYSTTLSLRRDYVVGKVVTSLIRNLTKSDPQHVPLSDSNMCLDTGSLGCQYQSGFRCFVI